MRQSLIILFALFALNANANTERNNDPFGDYLGLEIEKLELEQTLFGETASDEIISVDAVSVIELEEELELGFDTANYLPENFDANKGMDDINWDEIKLYELEEELEIGFDTKEHLPLGFNPYTGMKCSTYARASAH